MDVMMEMRRSYGDGDSKVSLKHTKESKRRISSFYIKFHMKNILQHNNLHPKDFNGNKKNVAQQTYLRTLPFLFLFFCFPWPFLSSQLPSLWVALPLSGYLPSFSSHHLPPCSCISKYGAFNHQHGWPSPCHVHQLVSCVGKRGPHLSQVLPSSSNAMKNP